MLGIPALSLFDAMAKYLRTPQAFHTPLRQDFPDIFLQNKELS